MKIINNPLFKITGILLILYLALFQDNKNKENLRNRLSEQKIKDNLSYIKDRTIYIKQNIKKSQQAIENQQDQNQPVLVEPIKVKPDTALPNSPQNDLTKQNELKTNK